MGASADVVWARDSLDRAEALLRACEPESALEVVETVIREGPDCELVPALFVKAQIFAAQGRDDDARRQWELVTTHPVIASTRDAMLALVAEYEIAAPRLYTELPLVIAVAHKVDRALRSTTDVRQLGKLVPMARWLVFALATTDQFDQTLELGTTILRSVPEGTDKQFDLCRTKAMLCRMIAFSNLGRDEEAEQEGERLTAQGGRTLRVLDNWIEAVRRVANPELLPRVVYANFLKAVTLEKMAQRNDAKAVLADAIAEFDEHVGESEAIRVGVAELRRLDSMLDGTENPSRA